MKMLYTPLSLPLCLATMHDPMPILISILFGLYMQSGMCGSVPEMCDILKPSRCPSFQSGLKPVLTTQRFPPQGCG